MLGNTRHKLQSSGYDIIIFLGRGTGKRGLECVYLSYTNQPPHTVRHSSPHCTQGDTHRLIAHRVTVIASLHAGRHSSPHCTQGDTHRLIARRMTVIASLHAGRQSSPHCTQDDSHHLNARRMTVIVSSPSTQDHLQRPLTVGGQREPAYTRRIRTTYRSLQLWPHPRPPSPLLTTALSPTVSPVNARSSWPDPRCSISEWRTCFFWSNIVQENLTAESTVDLNIK